MNTAAGIEDMLEDFQGSWGGGGGRPGDCLTRKPAREGPSEAPLSSHKPCKNFDVMEGNFLELLQRATSGLSKDLDIFTSWFRGGRGQGLGMWPLELSSSLARRPWASC